MWLNGLFALLGLLIAMLINALADYLPAQRTAAWTDDAESAPPRLRLRPPALWRRVRSSETPRRDWLVELALLLLFAALPSLIPEPVNLLVNSWHIAVLMLVIVIDLEHRLIFDVVTLPATLLAMLGSLIVVDGENSLGLALVGAVTGFVIFGLLYAGANWIYGQERVPFGFGDVKLALALGAMVGFHRILFTIVLAIFLGGVGSALLLLTRRAGRGSAVPYGQYLAVAGIVMLIWGAAYVQQYMAAYQ